MSQAERRAAVQRATLRAESRRPLTDLVAASPPATSPSVVKSAAAGPRPASGASECVAHNIQSARKKQEQKKKKQRAVNFVQSLNL